MFHRQRPAVLHRRGLVRLGHVPHALGVGAHHGDGGVEVPHRVGEAALGDRVVGQAAATGDDAVLGLTDPGVEKPAGRAEQGRAEGEVEHD
jgi:hypothetical protein